MFPILPGIVILGDIYPFALFGIIGVWVSILDKYFPPLLAVFPHLPILSLSYFHQVYITGTPLALALQIFLKSITNTLITTLLFTLLIAIPYLYEILPLRYDSWVARYWLLKLEDTPPNIY
jgi:hypothetical protein